VRHPEGETIDLRAVADATIGSQSVAIAALKACAAVRDEAGRPMDSRRFPETKHIAVKSDLLGLLPAGVHHYHPRNDRTS
jgi:hypothetical protein